jgi:hypothetical protein
MNNFASIGLPISNLLIITAWIPASVAIRARLVSILAQLVFIIFYFTPSLVCPFLLLTMKKRSDSSMIPFLRQIINVKLRQN